VQHVDALFPRNERLVLALQCEPGRVALVCVGATAVGCISSPFTGTTLDEPLPVRRGDEVARFNLGSTVVLLFPPQVRLRSLAEGDRLHYGEAIADDRREQPSA
jgi:phosphatidylserine decarboxylase